MHDPSPIEQIQVFQRRKRTVDVAQRANRGIDAAARGHLPRFIHGQHHRLIQRDAKIRLERCSVGGP